MKKAISLILALLMCLSLCACGGAGESGKEPPLTVETATGNYKSVGLFFDHSYTAKENTTYDKTPRGKGTWAINTDGGITFSPADGMSEYFAKRGDHLYRTGGLCSFDEDETYGLVPTFDQSGRTDQYFKQLYRDINRSYTVILDLNADGTFTSQYKVIHNMDLATETDDRCEGTYRFENDTLWLSCEGTEYPMLLVDGQLYFDIITKAE